MFFPIYQKKIVSLHKLNSNFCVKDKKQINDLTMKRNILITIIIALSAILPAKAFTFGNETLRYDIVYHWGLIWKHAGAATLKIAPSGDNYSAQLSARTISWADKIFTVRDTLSCSMTRHSLQPLLYRKASHEGDHNGLDVVKYSYADGKSHAQCTRYRSGRTTNNISLETDGQAYDMLSIFYYLRSLNFKGMKKGATIKTTIFSGKRKETITIKYAGVETIELRDESKHKAYHVTFAFTQDGKSKSSDDMHTWISTTPAHVPLMLKGKLPIGEVRCYLSK